MPNIQASRTTHLTIEQKIVEIQKYLTAVEDYLKVSATPGHYPHENNKSRPLHAYDRGLFSRLFSTDSGRAEAFKGVVEVLDAILPEADNIPNTYVTYIDYEGCCIPFEGKSEVEATKATLVKELKHERQSNYDLNSARSTIGVFVAQFLVGELEIGKELLAKREPKLYDRALTTPDDASLFFTKPKKKVSKNQQAKPSIPKKV